MQHIAFLFLTRLAGNGIGDEGARMLAEPLGKLTALQQLDLAGTGVCYFACLIVLLRAIVRCATLGLCFLFALQATELALKVQGCLRGRSAS